MIVNLKSSRSPIFLLRKIRRIDISDPDLGVELCYFFLLMNAYNRNDSSVICNYTHIVHTVLEKSLQYRCSDWFALKKVPSFFG